MLCCQTRQGNGGRRGRGEYATHFNLLFLTFLHQYLVRINLGTQGHVLWIPRTDYELITNNGAQLIKTKSAKGKTYYLPLEVRSEIESKSLKRHIRIAMAIIHHDMVLVVVDFNMHSLRLNLTKLSRPFSPSDFDPPISKVMYPPSIG